MRKNYPILNHQEKNRVQMRDANKKLKHQKYNGIAKGKQRVKK
jgi:hypothetical protein